MYRNRAPWPRVFGPLFAVLLVTSLAVALMAGVGVSGSSGARAVPAGSAAHPDASCNNVGWQTTHLRVWASSCQATFEVTYAQNFSDLNATNQYSFAFSVSWVAELNMNGDLVQAADALTPYSGSANITFAGNEINVASWMALNVTNATGNWTPNDSAWGSGPQWNTSGPTVGVPTLAVAFHLQNSTINSLGNGTRNPALAVKFDVGVYNWPWYSPFDHLGIELDSVANYGAHFSFNNSSHSLTEEWNANNASFVNLLFGTNATTLYTYGWNLNSSVEEQVGLFSAADSTAAAVTLVTFPGPPPPHYYPGGYPRLIYDPWVLFTPTAVPQLSHPAVAGGPAWLPMAGATLVLGGGLAGIVMRVARNERLHREGTALLAGMREAIDRASEVSNRPR